MLRALLTAALALAALMAGAFPNDASAGGWRGRPYRDGGAVLYPGWGYYSFPWATLSPRRPTPIRSSTIACAAIRCRDPGA